MDVAIIGTSTNMTDEEGELIVEVASTLVSLGHIVRTGGAICVDMAAIIGACKVNPALCHVYLPWASYNRQLIPDGCARHVYDTKVHSEWTKSVEKYHPNPKALTFGAWSLHARNYGIIIGERPVDIVIALPRSLKESGGTGQGLRIAEAHGIPGFNLREPGAVDDMLAWIDAL